MLLTITVLDGCCLVSAQTWTQTGAPNNSWSSIAVSADGTKLAAVIGGKSPTPIYLSTSSGISWTTNNTPSAVWSHVASSADGDILIASTAYYITSNLVYISTNAGATWISNTNVPTLGALACSSDGKKWIATVAGTGGIYTSTNSGTTWALCNVPLGYWVAVASSADGSKLAAAMSTNIAAYTYQVYVSMDSGATWNLTSAPELPWSSLAFSADGIKLAATANRTAYTLGAIFVSTNSGVNWTQAITPNNMWRSVSCSADGNKLIAAAPYDYSAQVSVPLYISTDGGNTWDAASSQNKIWEAVASSADGNRLFAISALGGIWTSYSTPPPQLSVATANSALKFSWLVPSTNFVLQQSSDLSSWSDVTDSPALNLTNLQDEVVLSPTNDSGFFRLESR
ncbi:MAG: hypothetical protein WDM76_18935 [Limisphaerales bacterium]